MPTHSTNQCKLLLEFQHAVMDMWFAYHLIPKASTKGLSLVLLSEYLMNKWLLNAGVMPLINWETQKERSNVTIPWHTGAGAVHRPKSVHWTRSAPSSLKPSAQWKLQLVLSWNALEDGEQSMLPWIGPSSGPQAMAKWRKFSSETG